MFNTNTGKIIIEDVICENGSVKYDGDFAVAGVKGTASPIKLRFVDPSGTLKTIPEGGTKLLPTGNVVDTLNIPDFGNVDVSIVDAANPLVFVKATVLGLRGDELPMELDANQSKLDLLEKVRGMSAVRLGLCEDYTQSAWETPGIPKLTIVAAPSDYQTVDGTVIKEENIDILSRMMSMQKTHPTYAMTGAMCTAAAAVVPRSIVNQVIRPDVDTQFIRIAHPGGILEAGVNYHMEQGDVVIEDTFGFRTANLLMEGNAFAD